MEQSTFKRYSFWGELGIWSLLFFIYFMEEIAYSDVLTSLVYSFTILACLINAAYGHYYQLLPLLIQQNKWRYLVLTFLWVSLFSSLIAWLSAFFAFDDEQTPFSWNFLYYFFLILIIAAVLSLKYFVEAWYHNFQKENQLKNEQLQAELNFLKSQINPHFLFNTLNNIYAYAQTGHPRTAPMIERLSSILRFMVYDCGENRVSLLKELNAVEDLLEIHKMKNSEQRNIQLSIDGVKAFHLVAPLIIVNFVENACKHSDVLQKPDGFIHVQLVVDETDQCQFEITNSFKKRHGGVEKYRGLGLKNIQKRLNLQYQNDYTLEEKKVDHRYHLKLIIPLERKK
ncbi:MAG: histidine kinase [Bacteroidota bacterium]